MKEPEYLNPDFSDCRRIHEWKNYIGQETANIWHTFTDEQKQVLYFDAEYRAGLEEWD